MRPSVLALLVAGCGSSAVSSTSPLELARSGECELSVEPGISHDEASGVE